MEDYFRKENCPSCEAKVEEMLWEEDLWRASCQCGSRWFTETSRQAILEQRDGTTTLSLTDEVSTCRAAGERLAERCRLSPVATPESNGNGSPKQIDTLLTKVGKYRLRAADAVLATDTETREEFYIAGKELAEQLVARGEGHGEQIMIVLYTGEEQLRWLNTVTHLLRAK